MITGSLAGILVSIIPGITSATGTVIAMNARKQSTPQQTIVILSAVNTACAFSVIAALFIILRLRSGATSAINELISLEPWSSFLLLNTLAYFLMFLIFAGLLSYFFTLYFGKVFAKIFNYFVCSVDSAHHCFYCDFGFFVHGYTWVICVAYGNLYWGDSALLGESEEATVWVYYCFQ